jgi:predicted flap endonuclease-1-like 5' DNA nuclease
MSYLVTQMLLCLLAAFVLGWLLGWWLRGRRCEEKIAGIEADWRVRLERATADAKARIDQTEARLLALKTPATREAPARPDDLTQIEGIGPAIARLLASFEALAAAKPSELQRILQQAGEKFRIHDPSTWPEQARLAAAGQWDKLAQLQDELVGGRRIDDLTRIEGIGPQIESLLRDAGIASYAVLAGTTVERLSEILHAAGERFRIHDPTSWPEQARLAADGEWTILARRQDELRGGRAD